MIAKVSARKTVHFHYCYDIEQLQKTPSIFDPSVWADRLEADQLGADCLCFMHSFLRGQIHVIAVTSAYI